MVDKETAEKEHQAKVLAYKKHAALRENLTGYAFLAPNIIGFFTFTFFPVFASFVLAFCQWDIITEVKFVGLKNFIVLIQDKLFWKYFANTLFFMIGIPIGMTVSLILALLMNQKLRGIVVFRTIYFMPVVSSLIAVALLWRWIYNPDFGLLNSFLRMLGFRNVPQWLASTSWSKPAIMLMSIWRWAGYNMILYLAALQGIPPQLYEAASIDGANTWRKFWHITFPMLGPTNFFIVVMSIIGTFQTFGEIYVMTGGGPAGSTTTIVYYIYNNAFQWFKMGYASAIAWFLFLVMFLVTLAQWKYAGQKVEYSVT
ncbi:MAG: sugar ABC transporter permease [Spirochaetes bacterium]|nr:sugar ABC transporter permease [Spirochaetota bacterium]